MLQVAYRSGAPRSGGRRSGGRAPPIGRVTGATGRGPDAGGDVVRAAEAPAGAWASTRGAASPLELVAA